MATPSVAGYRAAIAFTVIFAVALLAVGITYLVRTVHGKDHKGTTVQISNIARLAPGGSSTPTSLAPGATPGTLPPGAKRMPMQRPPTGKRLGSDGGNGGNGGGGLGGMGPSNTDGFGGVGGSNGSAPNVVGPVVSPTSDDAPGLLGLPRSQQALFNKAQNAERRSDILARTGDVVYSGAGGNAANAAKAANVHLPAGASDGDASVAAQAAALKARYGFSELPGGAPLQSVIAETEGKSLSHAGKTAINNTGHLDSAWADDSSHFLRKFLPEEADKLDKALSMSATPTAFYNDDATHEVRRRTEMVKAMLLEGAVDPSIQDVLAAAAPFQASRNMLLRAVTAQDQLDRTMVNRPPTRFLYQNPLYREATPVPTMSSIVQDNMTPGQQYYLQSISCATQNLPVVQEPY